MSEHLKKITAKAKQLKKQHPNTAWTELIKKASKLVKSPTKKAAPKKKAAVSGTRSPRPRKEKTKIVIRKNKGGALNVKLSGIGAISNGQLSKLNQEIRHRDSLQTRIKSHQEQMKGMKPAERAQQRKMINVLKSALLASKQHITALKRTI